MDKDRHLTITDLRPGKYIVAVSGGVDSIALLNVLITTHRSTTKYKFIVAHYDHGIRKDSASDRKLVEKNAEKYGLQFEYEEGVLGENTSEAQAREARYKFLKNVASKHNADAIVTAHNQDDVIETLLINLIRGTGRRGVLKETDEIRRPLLNTPKSDIIRYAKDNNLKWREDKTNQDTKYLRNYVRLVLIPRMKHQDSHIIEKLIDSDSSLKSLNKEIDASISILMEEQCNFTKKRVIIPRHWLIMAPNQVGREIIYEAVRHLDMQSGVDKKNLKNLLVFAKTAKVHKKTPIHSNMNMRIEPGKIILELV